MVWTGSKTIRTTPSNGSDDNDGIHLAVSPQCGHFSDSPDVIADVNTGLNLTSFKTIVAFGDSFTDGGKQDGSPLDPPVLIPPNPQAGGRATNGEVWIETVARRVGARFMDYAQGGACTDMRLWPSIPWGDFVGQTKTFLNQGNRLDNETTLYVVFFGINDFEASKRDGDHLQAAAEAILTQLRILASPPTSARSFLLADVYGRGTHTPSGERYRRTLFTGLHSLSLGHYIDSTDGRGAPLTLAFVDFARIWDGVLGADPGYAAFGYSSTDACAVCDEHGCTMEGMCDDPEHHFYWLPGHPSKQTNRIMADYAQRVLSECIQD